MKIAGRSDALSIIFGAVYLVGAGTGDFLLNYYMNPLLYNVYTPDQFSDIVVGCYANFIQVYIYICLSQPDRFSIVVAVIAVKLRFFIIQRIMVKYSFNYDRVTTSKTVISNSKLK